MPGSESKKSVEKISEDIIALFPQRNEALAIPIIELAQFYCDKNHRSYVNPVFVTGLLFLLPPYTVSAL